MCSGEVDQRKFMNNREFEWVHWMANKDNITSFTASEYWIDLSTGLTISNSEYLLFNRSPEYDNGKWGI